MKRLLVLWLVGGCVAQDEAAVEPEPPFFDIGVYFDPTCDLGRAGLALEAFGEWARFGVSVTELQQAGEPSLSDVTVCVAFADIGGTRAGSTVWAASGTTTDITGDASDYVTGLIAQHELGHVVLHSANHLAPTDRGIMASGVGRMIGGWSDADAKFLEARGVVPLY